MLKQQGPNERYWAMMKKNQVREEYNRFLADQGMELNPDSAQIFAAQKIAGAGGHVYHDMTEREMILLLAGALHYMYD